MATIDYATHPHIVSRICRYAGWSTQLVFRGMCRDLLNLVDSILFEHMAIVFSSLSEDVERDQTIFARSPVRHHTLPLLEYPRIHTTPPPEVTPPVPDDNDRLPSIPPSQPKTSGRGLAALWCNALPPGMVSKLSCATAKPFDEDLPLLVSAPPVPEPSRRRSVLVNERSALSDRWERALRLSRVVELHGYFDPSALSFWAPGGPIKKLLGRRDVEVVIDKRTGAGPSPLGCDSWACWLNASPTAGTFDLVPPTGACSIVANFAWRRHGELSLDLVADFLSSDEVNDIASNGGDISLVFHVLGEPEDLRPMEGGAKEFIAALTRYLRGGRERRNATTLTLAGLEAMNDADLMAMGLNVRERSPDPTIPTAMWCILRTLQERMRLRRPDRLVHVTLDDWVANGGRHAALMVDPRPFAAA